MRHTYFTTARDQDLLHGELSIVVDAIGVENVERGRDGKVANGSVDVQDVLVRLLLGRYRSGQHRGETIEEKPMLPFVVY